MLIKFHHLVKSLSNYGVLQPFHSPVSRSNVIAFALLRAVNTNMIAFGFLAIHCTTSFTRMLRRKATVINRFLEPHNDVHIALKISTTRKHRCSQQLPPLGGSNCL